MGSQSGDVVGGLGGLTLIVAGVWFGIVVLFKPDRQKVSQLVSTFAEMHPGP
jgi:hypothetical protein